MREGAGTGSYRGRGWAVTVQMEGLDGLLYAIVGGPAAEITNPLPRVRYGHAGNDATAARFVTTGSAFNASVGS